MTRKFKLGLALTGALMSIAGGVVGVKYATTATPKSAQPEGKEGWNMPSNKDRENASEERRTVKDLESKPQPKLLDNDISFKSMDSKGEIKPAPLLIQQEPPAIETKEVPPPVVVSSDSNNIQIPGIEPLPDRNDKPDGQLKKDKIQPVVINDPMIQQIGGVQDKGLDIPPLPPLPSSNNQGNTGSSDQGIPPLKKIKAENQPIKSIEVAIPAITGDDKKVEPIDPKKEGTANSIPAIPTIDSTPSDQEPKKKVTIKVPSAQGTQSEPKGLDSLPPLQNPSLEDPNKKNDLLGIPPAPISTTEIKNDAGLRPIDNQGLGTTKNDLNMRPINNQGTGSTIKEMPPPSLLDLGNAGSNPQPKVTEIKLDAPTPPKLKEGTVPSGRDYDEDLHQTKQGDTMVGIARQYYQDEAYAQALEKYNRDFPTNNRYVRVPPIDILNNRYPDVVPGQGVRPVATVPAPTTPAIKSATADNKLEVEIARSVNQIMDRYPIYVVGEGGETLADIAQKTLQRRENWSFIKQLNISLDETQKLAPGTQLRLPEQAIIPAANRAQGVRGQ